MPIAAKCKSIGPKLFNPVFKGGEFETFRKQAGLNSFHLTPRKWIDATQATGIQSRAGRYGGRPIITKIETCIHDGFVVFESLTSDQLFLYYVLSHIEGDWSKHDQTGSQMNWNTALINRTVVQIPTVRSEQTAIATILSDMDTEIAALEAKLTKTRQLKQGMMAELLTGRTRLV